MKYLLILLLLFSCSSMDSRITYSEAIQQKKDVERVERINNQLKLQIEDYKRLNRKLKMELDAYKKENLGLKHYLNKCQDGKG